MSAPRPDVEADSWAFALAIYARPGVAEACLALQNEAGVDVMLLLMAAFAAIKHRILLTAEEIKAMDAACRPWREHIVWRLRAIRTELKTGPKPAPDSETGQFRSKIKALELEAEKLENRLLAEGLPLARSEKEAARLEQLRSILNHVVMLFADRRGTNLTASCSSSIDIIVNAAMQDSS
jgi:uncharacterized protein (TIGR02444 family)